MKKILFLVAFAWAAIASTHAQSSTVATLNHKDTISTYYGYSALQQAHAAAVDGDIITLSAGSFGSVQITKAITLRGAGMGVGDSAEPTVIVGDFNINRKGIDGVNNKLTIEGIYTNHHITFVQEYNTQDHEYNGVTFIKCRLKSLDTQNGNHYSWYRAYLKNAIFFQCYIAGQLTFDWDTTSSFINCYLYKPWMDRAVFDFQNCVIWENEGSNNIVNSTFTNCIIYSTTTDTAHKFNANNTAKNCVVINDSINVLANISDSSNKFVTSLADVFQNFRGTYADNITFELTDAAKTQYLGLDGTEVGIYGGALAFDPAPSTPRITKCVVAPKSTADGKLKVTITVSATE